MKSNRSEQNIEIREEMNEPGYRAQGSKVPSRHFQPGYQPDQCGWRCTLSSSPIEMKKTEKGNQGFTG